MLEFMRKSINSIFIKALLFLLIASFAVWGIGDVFRSGGSADSVATVGESQISTQEFRAAFAREVQRIGQTFGQQFTQEQAQAMGVDRMVLTRMVSTALQDQGAASLGMMIPDAVVLDEIHATQAFFNDAGQFDRRVFTEILSRNGFSEDSYVALVRQDIARSQFLSPIIAGTVTPANLINAIYANVAERRVLDVVRLNHAQVRNVPQPTNEELAAFHQAQSQRFMAPEMRTFSAIVLTAEDAAKAIEVSADELAAAYDERLAEFTTTETRTLRQILVGKDKEADAKRAVDLLNAGKSIEEVAKSVGANAAMINIGDFTKADAANLSADIADAAFALSLDGYSQPVQSPLGWHVIQVSAIKAGHVKPLDEVKDQLTKQLREERALDELFARSNQLEDLLGGGMTLGEAASELGVDLISVAGVDAQGKLADGKTSIDVPAAQDLLGVAFTLGEGDDSPLSETKDGNAYFVVHLDGVQSPELRPLGSVLTQVAQAWDATKRAEMANELAKTAQSRLLAGEDLNTVAAELGFDAFVTDPFTRDGQGLQLGALPADLMGRAFTLPQSGVTMAEGTGAHTVARVQKIIPVNMDLAATDEMFTAVQDQTTRELQNDLVVQLTSALQGMYPVSYNQNALAQ